jgi:hypothetical protein
MGLYGTIRGEGSPAISLAARIGLAFAFYVFIIYFKTFFQLLLEKHGFKKPYVLKQQKNQRK